MGKAHAPRHGSLQFWPRKRSKRLIPRVRNWNGIELKNQLQEVKPLGFMGFKVGMTHVLIQDNTSKMYKGTIRSFPVTVIECPPLKVSGVNVYSENYKGKFILDSFFYSDSKHITRKLPKPKKKDINAFFDNLDKDKIKNIRLLVHTQPYLTGIGAKKPYVFEVALSGNLDDKLKKAIELNQKEINVTDLFKQGMYVDVRAITKGKGFQGTVKRYGVTLRSHKSEKTIRDAGNLGAWIPKRVLFSVPQAGKMGYHQRTHYNQLIVKVSNNPEEIKIKGGFLRYGFVKNPFILVKGSIQGSIKRPVLMTYPIRNNKPEFNLEVKQIILDSQN